MIDVQEMLEALGVGVFPNAIQFVWVLLALMGIVTIGLGLYNLYQIASDGPQPGGATEGGSFVRIVLGGFMVIPSITLWHAANVFLDGGDSTAEDLLAYATGAGAITGCDNFSRAIQLGFMLMGCIAIYRAFRNADDQAKGFSRDGYRTAVIYFIGGIGCFFINDLMHVVGNELGFDIGFEELCSAVGA